MNVDKACEKAVGSQELAVGAWIVFWSFIGLPLGIRFTKIQPQNSELSQTVKSKP